MKLGSLFDGSGGFPLAGRLVGISTAWSSEIDPYCIEVTKKNFPETVQLGDITKINGAEIEPVDIITFGSPCQNISFAGNRKGLAGEQSSLFFEAIRIIKEMRNATEGQYPNIIVWENVAGAYSSNEGEDFRTVLNEIGGIAEEGFCVPRLEKWTHAGEILADGFSIAWRTLDAQYWGLPATRKRCFLVGCFGNRSAGQILFEREGLCLDPQKVFGKGDDSSERNGRCVERTGKSSQIVEVYTTVCNARKINVAPTIDHKGGSPVCNQGGVIITESTSDEDLTKVYNTGSKKCKEITIADTVDTNGYSAIHSNQGGITVVKNKRIRRLTPKECGRLQGFPDDWCTGVKGGDTVQYRMWGNGIALPCVLYIMEGCVEKGDKS